jgi:hypothetical protein
LSLLSSAAYIFAEWASQERKEANVKTLNDFIGPYVEPSSGTSTMASTPRNKHYAVSHIRSSTEKDLDGAKKMIGIITSSLDSPSTSTATIKGYLPHTDSESNILRQSLDAHHPED